LVAYGEYGKNLIYTLLFRRLEYTSSATNLDLGAGNDHCLFRNQLFKSKAFIQKREKRARGSSYIEYY
jgi:hypothetical protein